MSLIGRNEEVQTLEQFYESAMSEFLALYGRRRVGKTYLIREYFTDLQNCLFFNVTGTKGVPMKEQIRHFTTELSKVFYGGIPLQATNNWDKTFDLLTKAINEQVPEGKKVVIFMDELPWMATRRSRLLETLDYYWNQHWTKVKHIKLIICGSSASWIINKIINNRGGLHNRVTREIHLEPFNLLQTKRFLELQGVDLSNRQLLQLYMVTGGVPFYLTKIERGQSAVQIIEKLAFSKKAFLLDEFDKLFASLFDNSELYIKVVRLLAENRYGIGERKLLEQMGKVGGQGKKMLNDLVQTGFITSFKPLYHARKGIYYRLTDEYTIFYLKWIAPLRSTLERKALESGYWQSIQSTPEWYSWLGYTFESVCYKHILHIKKALKLQPTDLPSSWRYVPAKGSKQKGAQIDLLFDRRDDAITLCEIKYTDEPYQLTKEYVDNIQQKIAVFKERTHTQKQIFFALVSANGLKNNYYADSIISGVVTLEDLFKEHM